MNNSNTTYNVDFYVPLSRSLLFDLHTEYLALKLKAKFPGLDTETEQDKNCIHVFGNLNDYWLEKFNRSVFELGILEEEEN